METSLDVITSGYNGVLLDDEVYRITGGNGKTLYLRSEKTQQSHSVVVDDVEIFVFIRKKRV